MLKHKEEIDAKDTEIVLLKARLAMETNREETVDITPRCATGDTVPSAVNVALQGTLVVGKHHQLSPLLVKSLMFCGKTRSLRLRGQQFGMVRKSRISYCN